MTVASITAPQKTPADLTITPRDRRFGREDPTPRLWHGGKVEATALYNALSATFPVGEAFFVESVRAFRDGADPKLAEDIKNFTTQEVVHSREHLAFNRRAADSGYDLTALEAQVEKRLAITRSKPKIVSLAATMALEHFTAILAHELLADPRHLAGAEEATAALWKWHASEEIEHKGVAYDTWLHATKDWTAAKRQGAGDDLRDTQLRRRPHRGGARADAAGRGRRAARLGATGVVCAWRTRHDAQDLRRVAGVLPAGVSPVERRRSRADRRV